MNYPKGTLAGDLVLLVLLDNSNHPSTISSSGWADIDHSTDDSSMGLESWWHTAGTETSVTIEHLHTSGNVHGRALG
ncbi:hypothetical protein [Arthrobacter polaris]|uniref:hypothetical protein n=1 Tax=Arthrobacter polaris TaxID=2813727 RepID=UPI001F318CAD|nr:hypothetical protein [Arthrobacter polaris]UIK89386.1 hypothetical protein J0916_02690 [Arthrobacter polaris]